DQMFCGVAIDYQSIDNAAAKQGVRGVHLFLSRYEQDYRQILEFVEAERDRSRVEFVVHRAAVDVEEGSVGIADGTGTAKALKLGGADHTLSPQERVFG